MHAHRLVGDKELRIVTGIPSCIASNSRIFTCAVIEENKPRARRVLSLESGVDVATAVAQLLCTSGHFGGIM